MIRTSLSVFIALMLMMVSQPAGAVSPSRVVSSQIVSRNFADSRIGVAAVRRINVYLPAGYDDTKHHFPVIYFLSGFFEDETAPFVAHDAKAVLDGAIAAGVIGDVIVVTADFTTPMGGSWYVNSSATGRWEDFMVRELVPFVDHGYRTLADRNSRGIAGDRMGGYGALRFGMRHPDIFGSVYALHPIGIGTGLQPMFSRPNWALLASAGSLDDLKVDGFSQIFTSIFQAFLPDPARAPLFFDPPARRDGDRLVIDAAITGRLQDAFFLDRQVAAYADKLKSLRGLKFDWARNDPNPDHIISIQAFTHTLDEFGIAYEAEEYRGGWGDRHWGSTGRVVTDMLPFFRANLLFAPGAAQSR